MSKKLLMPSFLWIALSASVGCNKTGDLAGPPQSTLSSLVATSSFSLFNNAVTKAGLSRVLLTSPALTLFAPDNAAFAASGLTQKWIDTNTAATIEATIRYHIAGSTIGSAGFPAADTVRSIAGNGTAVFLNKSANGVFANGIKIQQADVAASNGVMHVLARALTPPLLTLTNLLDADTTLSLFDTALGKALIKSALVTGHYTLLAPNNAAFRRSGYPSAASISALSDSAAQVIFNLHVIQNAYFYGAIADTTALPTRVGTTFPVTFRGSPLRVNITNNPADTAGFVSTDRLATNGVLHVIDHLLLTK